MAIEQFVAQDGTLAVSDKYQQLMADSIGEGSIYERTKDTFFELFKDLNISEAERIQLVANNISNLANQISAQAMTSALAWAKEERDATFQLAQIKAQTELALAQKELTSKEIDKALVEEALLTAQKDETLASTIRNDALNTAQVDGQEAQNYNMLADAFRKSGNVNIGTDLDGVKKGLSGDNFGYTYKQDNFITRQEKSFEESKRNHAANSSAQMIGQLLSAEIPITETDTAFVLWKNAMDYLTTNTP